MRKTFGLALIALLVMLALASCDGIGPKSEDAGNGLVTLTINTGETAGNSRSLSNTHAHAQDWLFVEVVFKFGSTPKYYRGSGYYGQDITMSVPVGTYDGTTNDAILLIGKKTDGTLLATGVLASTGITTATTNVTFTVTSLAADISTVGTDLVFTNEGSLFSGKTKLGNIGADTCFQVQTDQSSVTGTLTFSAGLASTGSKLKVIAPAVTGDDLKITKIAGAALTSPSVTPATGGNFGSNKIVITFDTPTSNAPSLVGAHEICFNIPVVAFAEEFTNPSATPPTGPLHYTWYIRGGTKTGFDFTGGEERGIILLVKDTPDQEVDINIKTGGSY